MRAVYNPIPIMASGDIELCWIGLYIVRYVLIIFSCLYMIVYVEWLLCLGKLGGLVGDEVCWRHL